jgi:predicted alpha/beta superfamily hydrolase
MAMEYWRSGARRGGACSLASSVLLLLSALAAPARSEPAATTPVVLPQTQEIAMKSKEGLDYRIFVYIPATPAPPNGYPVIYALDGNAWFTPLAFANRMMAGPIGISPAVIVGVGYPGDAPFNQLRRFYDDTDTPLVEKVPPGFTPPKFGGAEQFLQFIRGELKPKIEGLAKIDPERQTLFGHSLGCSFTFHVLFTRTSAFQNYVCASPSLYFNGAFILHEADAFLKSAATNRVKAKLVFAVAEYDGKVQPGLPPEMARKFAEQVKEARIVTGARELNARLQAVRSSGLDTTFIEIPEENHISEVPVLINRMMPIILKPAPGA